MRRARAAPVLKTIAANVRARRRELDLTQEELAEAADVETSYVQKIERGIANITIEVLVSVADALEVPPASLFAMAAMEKRAVGRPRSVRR